MSMFDAMRIAASGLSAERMRMDVIAENIANANSQGYRRQEVLVQARQGGGLVATAGSGVSVQGSDGVEVVGIVEDPSPLRAVYDPSNPGADANGYVYMPNVNPVTEMVDMTTATRAYEANVTAMTDAKNMVLRALDILK